MRRLKNVALMLGMASTIAVSSVGLFPQLGAAEGEKAARPHMDLAFCIDTTGSMQGEIDMVKTKMKELVAKLAGGKPAPVIRVGLVAYRDRGDEYVTRVFPFSEDIDKVVKDISNLKADGGGDEPEAVNQGMHAAINDLKWDADNKTAKLLFLIGDAPPNQYPGDFKWQDESKKAIAHGIQINTIGCGSFGPAASDVFKTIAKLADGKFEMLAYRREVVNSAGARETIISSGGESYKVRAGAAAEWKSGVAALSSKGMLDKVSAGTAAAYAAAPALAGARATRGRAMMRMPMAPASASFASASDVFESGTLSAGGGGGMSGSRADNNLDEILLGAAKEKAAKSLKVDFKK